MSEGEKQRGDPRLWIPPRWHADLGDPEVELEKFRAFAVALRAVLPEVEVELDCFEPGYMCARVTLGSEIMAEVHVDPHDGRIALFVDPEKREIETRFDQPSEAASFLARLDERGREATRSRTTR